MKLPSLSELLQTSLAAYYRFPFTLINAAVGTVAALILADHTTPFQENPLNNVVAATLPGISLLTTIVLFCERRKWSFGTKLTAQIAGALLLAAYAMTLPHDIFASTFDHGIRLVFLMAGFHFLSAAAPFMGFAGTNGFWQYNKTLFLRMLTAMLYSGVLFVGLAIALEALEQLFGLKIDSKRYFQLWIFLAGIFNTWFFLAGIPPDLEELDQSQEYPKGLKVFTQYILLPLVGVYLLILYAYMGKIVFARELPQGWVSKLVLGFSISGILSLLLVHPIADRTENIWIRTATKWYYVILLPLDAMLLIAILRRISDYGITESRYTVLVLALWLTGVSLYFVVSKAKNIKAIPASLCIIAFLVSFGPWGAFTISESSQLRRLSTLLQRYHILNGGAITSVHDTVPWDDAKEISSIIEYIVSVHGARSIQPWFNIPVDSVDHRENVSRHDMSSSTTRHITDLMGLEYVPSWQVLGSRSLTYTAVASSGISVDGYSLLVNLSVTNPTDNDSLPNYLPGVAIVTNPSTLVVRITSSGDAADTLTFDVMALGEKLKKEFGGTEYQYDIATEKMTLLSDGKKMRAKLIVKRLQRSQPTTKSSYNQLEADLLLGFRQQ